MTPRTLVALALADTMLARDAASMEAGIAWALGAEYSWVPPLCAAIRERTGEHFHFFSRSELAGIILGDDGFHAAWDPDRPAPSILHYCLDLPRETGKPAWLAALALPDLPSVGDLARWLELTPSELDWFADRWRATSVQPLQHYHYRWVSKRSGGARLIEIPKLRLRTMQQKILREILDRVPVHPAAHGFRRGHSCVTHAALHTGRRVVIRMDLKDFFPSIPASRIHAMFARLGYSETVAGVLARLCVNRVPAGVVREAKLPWQERQLFRTPHLPQGSPSSPALANACSYRLDLRLDALAASMHARYSRYADDLAFSGGPELERALDRFHVQVAAIAIEEGFLVNTRKTRMMRTGTRQQITGVVVNQHPNLPRAEIDRLKAMLTNCIRHGPRSQNRDGHGDYRAWLSGKVAYVAMVNPARGRSLRALLDRISWT